MENLIVTVKITINAPIGKVWDAFINPETVKKYMFGTTVISDWKEGSTIVWKGEWKGKTYEDKGKILSLKPKTELKYTHFSPLTGLPDIPDYHTVTINLIEEQEQTIVSLSPDNNTTEQGQENSKQNWTMMLTGLKNILEGKA